MTNPETSAAPRPQRYVLLDALRGLAAAAIIIHHFTADTGHGELFASASIAVDFFFCLSGFVLAHAYHQRLLGGMNLGDYALKRLNRLYPMYAIGTVLGLAGILLLKDRGLTDHTFASIAEATGLNLFYLPYLNGYYVDVFTYRLVGTIFPLNNPAWSLFFGVLANIFYAVSLRMWGRSPLAWLALSAVGLYVATFVYGEAPGWGTSNFIGGLPRVMFSFFAGVVIFQLHDRAPALPRWCGPAVVALFLSLVVMPRFPGHRYYWIATVLVVVPAMVAVGSRCIVLPGGKLHALCTYSGRISYPLFCLHYPMLMYFSLLPRDDGRMTLFSSTFAGFVMLAIGFFFTTIVVAHFFMVRVEDPARAWISKRLALGRDGAA